MGAPIYAYFGASTALTITLTSLANSTAGVGRQSSMVANSPSDEGAQMVRVFYSVQTGASPVVGDAIYFYLLQGDNVNAAGANIRTDGAGASDAGITIVTASIVNVVTVTATANQTYTGSFLVRNPGPEWGIAVVNSSGGALNGSNGSLRYVTESVST